jgi:hypothetical protein
VASARFVKTGITPDEYDQMREKLGVGDTPPPGGVFHAAAVGEDGKIRVFEVWDSREQAEAWGEKVMAVRTEGGFGEGTPHRKPADRDIHVLPSRTRELERCRRGPEQGQRRPGAGSPCFLVAGGTQRSCTAIRCRAAKLGIGCLQKRPREVHCPGAKGGRRRLAVRRPRGNSRGNPLADRDRLQQRLQLKREYRPTLESQVMWSAGR